MFGWILQWNGYEPAVLKTSRAGGAPSERLGRTALVRSTVAVWPVPSLFVHATTSPTLALIVAGSNAKSAITAWTVPASVDGRACGAATSARSPTPRARSLVAGWLRGRGAGRGTSTARGHDQRRRRGDGKQHPPGHVGVLLVPGSGVVVRDLADGFVGTDGSVS